MSSVRSIFAIDEPPLADGERVLGVVRWDEFYPEWIIGGREPARRARGKRGHGGSLRKRRRAK